MMQMRPTRSHRGQVQRMGLRIAVGGTLLAVSFGCNFSRHVPTVSDTTSLVMVTASGQELRSVFEGLKPETRGLVDLQQGKLDAGGACEADEAGPAHNRPGGAGSASSDRSTTEKVGWLPVTSRCSGHYASLRWRPCWSGGINCFWWQCYYSGHGDYSRGCRFYVYWSCFGICPRDARCTTPP